MAYLDRLDEWVQQHQDRLHASGRVHYSKAPNDGRAKQSAQLTVLHEPNEVELVLWESGEAEFSYGSAADGTMKHHDLGSLVQLDQLLTLVNERVVALSAGRESSAG